MSVLVEKNASLSEQINELTEQYLQDALEPDLYASDFTQEHFDTLLDELFLNYEKERVLERMDSIRKAIEKHFQASGQECEVTIHEGSISVVNTFKKGVKTDDINRALTGLDITLSRLLNEKADYALQDNLLCFPEKVLSALYAKFCGTEIEEDYASLRSNIRLAAEEHFDLHTRDIILFLRKKLYIRYFVDVRTMRSNKEKRFLGASAEELEEIYNKHFPDNFEDILFDMAEDVINDALNFSRIDNLEFKAKYIEVFRTLVDIAMIEYTRTIEKETVMALNGFVLRRHFDNLLYLCAEILIEKVMNRDRQADIFLHFYNGETVVGKQGTKINKPFITDESGNIWNYSSIFSIMTQCAQYETKHDKLLADLSKLKASFEKAASLTKLSVQDDQKSNAKLTAAKQKLNACTALKEKLLSVSSPNKQEVSELKEIKAEEKLLLTEHDTCYAAKNDLALKLENAKIAERSRLKQFEVAKKNLSIMEKKGEELYRQQASIFTAIAKALIFR